MKSLLTTLYQFAFIFIIFILNHAFTYGKLFANAESIILHRSAESSGFHRTLVYNVTLNNWKGESQILIEEKIPKDIYVDSYELLNLIEENKIKIIAEKEINTEAPAYEAEPFSVLLCSHSKTNYHELKLAVHLRYQKPQDCDELGKFVKVTLGSPNLYIRSKSKYAKKSPAKDFKCHSEIEENYSWVEIPTAHLENHFEVPVGCTEHFYPVLILSTIVIGFATMYLFYVIMF
ncbi:hypothetical protein JTE90_016602 [Oedothorax gibbosus]|uniref:Phosphatidylinositol-glycan biosynthesis class X protein n=1 Tax=Oedothorax gibbosus TaxID=931172 RepID=A0AAV6UBH9_9ARAC|nr:hypothetical protein JTE90_016602 [Oedothorax gibbosus]